MTAIIDPKSTIPGQGGQKLPGSNNPMGEVAAPQAPIKVESGSDRVRNSPYPDERAAIVAS